MLELVILSVEILVDNVVSMGKNIVVMTSKIFQDRLACVCVGDRSFRSDLP